MLHHLSVRARESTRGSTSAGRAPGSGCNGIGATIGIGTCKLSCVRLAGSGTVEEVAQWHLWSLEGVVRLDWQRDSLDCSAHSAR